MCQDIKARGCYINLRGRAVWPPTARTPVLTIKGPEDVVLEAFKLVGHRTAEHGFNMRWVCPRFRILLSGYEDIFE